MSRTARLLRSRPLPCACLRVEAARRVVEPSLPPSSKACLRVEDAPKRMRHGRHAQLAKERRLDARALRVALLNAGLDCLGGRRSGERCWQTQAQEGASAAPRTSSMASGAG